MKKLLLYLLLFAIFVNLFWLNYKVIKATSYKQTIAIATKDTSDELEEYDPGRTTSDVLKASYQKVNAAIIGFGIDPNIFTGPHHGAGFVTSRNGSLFTIGWKLQKDPNDISPQRILPISSILCIDRPLTGVFGELCVVYYKGPFGETEFAFLMEDEFGKQFIERWKSYWLSQEPVSR
ncbi:MAG: hypothetical protein PHF37_02460 [Phycisphaerae bacterium]|nr:hypothetical protein [Phycisphaerae bacterium]